ncbi:unnamed protein product [Diamesa hyperborea]
MNGGLHKNNNNVNNNDHFHGNNFNNNNDYYADITDLDTSADFIAPHIHHNQKTKQWDSAHSQSSRTNNYMNNNNYYNNSTTNSFEAEDISTVNPVAGLRSASAGAAGTASGGGRYSGTTTAGRQHYSSLRGSSSTGERASSSNLYYSPAGTSYTILERDPYHHRSASENNYHQYQQTRSHSSNSYYQNKSHHHIGRPASASSPPSTTHQIYSRDREHLFRDRNFSSIPNIHQQQLTTRTIHMKRVETPVATTSNHSSSRHQSANSKTAVTSSASNASNNGAGFGICVKGNKTLGRGVVISRVEDGSPAFRNGLRAGDAILEINGQPFTSVTHEEALRKCVHILKSEKYISMTIRSPNVYSQVPKHHSLDDPHFDAINDELYLPIPQQYNSQAGPTSSSSLPPPTVGRQQQCAWMDRHGRPVSPPYEYGGRQNDRRDRIRRIDLLIESGQSLGLMIRGGIEYGLGIFVTGIDKDSVAERAGLMIGDQILEVNSTSFMEITHDEAVNLLKYHKRMTILIRDVGKIPHSCSSLDHPQSSSSWHAGDTTSHYGININNLKKKNSTTLTIEDKARALLSRHSFSNLLYYLTEYGAKGMTVEAFVSILLELLDTPEKHSLVSEIREMVYPEDRLRFDELMFRRGITVSNLGKNMASLYGRNGDYFSNREPRRGSDNQLNRYNTGSYLDGLRSLTQRVKSWYWGRPLSMQRLQLDRNGVNMQSNSQQHNKQSDPKLLSHIVPDDEGNLLVTIPKSKPILGIAIEGGANTKHPLPRIINIHENGAAFESGGLEVGQLILEVDNQKVEGMQHQEIARLIAESYAKPSRHEIQFFVTEAKKSNLEPKPTALIYLETLIVFIQLFFNIMFILL